MMPIMAICGNAEGRLQQVRTVFHARIVKFIDRCKSRSRLKSDKRQIESQGQYQSRMEVKITVVHLNDECQNDMNVQLSK